MTCNQQQPVVREVAPTPGPRRGKWQWAYGATGWNGFWPLYCSFMLLVDGGEKEPSVPGSEPSTPRAGTPRLHTDSVSLPHCSARSAGLLSGRVVGVQKI